MAKEKTFSMFVLAIIALWLTVSEASKIPETKPTKVDVQFVTPEKLQEILQENPDAVQLERKVLKDSDDLGLKGGTKKGQSRAVISYNLGARNGYDQLVAYDEAHVEWPSPRDVYANFDYPSGGGYGATLSYCEILIDQSNESGRAYVTRGGIGYRYISIVVEAYSTYWFTHRASFYGYY